MPSRVETEINRRFGERYRIGSAAAIELERAVLGSDYGATGYATVAQAHILADVLALEPGRRLLDVGAGCGWPGLYLASRTGCDVVVTDVPIEAVRRARLRAVQDGLGARSAAVVATGRHLPFRQASFDAIVHTDVLC